MQVEIISNKNIFPKQFEQNRRCSLIYNSNNLSDSFTYNNKAIAFKGNLPTPLSSKITELANGRISESIKFATTKIAHLGQLTYESVANKLNNQLAHLREIDIEGIINSFSPEDRPLAKSSLAHMSQWGRFESLNKLASNLSINGVPLYSEERTCLASSLEYLKSKGSFDDLEVKFVNDYSKIEGKCNILLDAFVLNRIAKDEKLVEYIKQNPNIQLCYPDGWIDGVNPFNQGSVEVIKGIVANVVSGAKTHLAKNGKSQNEAIGSALNESVVFQLKKLGLADRLRIIGGDRINKETIELPDIAKQFEQKGISADYLQRQIETEVPKKYRQLMLGAISSEAQIVDSRTLGLMMQDQHKRILEYAKQKGILPQNISYYVRTPYKSYGIIAQQYQAINNIHPDKIIDSAQEDDLIVILDDYTGSGASIYNSMMNVYQSTKNVIIAPLFSTEHALEYLDRMYEQMKLYDELVPKSMISFPIKIISSLKNSTFYKSLPQDIQKLADKIFVGKSDIARNSSIVFPHMAPDNNSTFFNQFIAPSWMLNGNGSKMDGIYWKDIKSKL